ncbi:hypothetical protein QUA82_13420 [Microcoleus sp. F8-D3]
MSNKAFMRNLFIAGITFSGAIALAKQIKVVYKVASGASNFFRLTK